MALLDTLVLPKLISQEIGVAVSQCGNFSIFLSLKFHVKSLFEILEVPEMPFFAILKSLNCAFWLFSAITKHKN